MCDGVKHLRFGASPPNFFSHTTIFYKYVLKIVQEAKLYAPSGGCSDGHG